MRKLENFIFQRFATNLYRQWSVFHPKPSISTSVTKTANGLRPRRRRHAFLMFDYNRLVTNSNEVIMCSSVSSVEDSGLCSECACASDCESSTNKTCTYCEQDDLESNSCPSILNHTREVQSHRVLHLVDQAESKMKFSLLSAKEKTRMSFRIGWM